MERARGDAASTASASSVELKNAEHIGPKTQAGASAQQKSREEEKHQEGQ